MSPSPDSPPVIIITVEDLHRTLQQAHLIGNLARRKFLEALLAMNRSRLYLLLGFPSVTAYSEASFGLKRSQTYEFLRVGEALESLPRLDEAYQKGELSWSAVQDISRVATPDTEAQWLAFKESHTLHELRAEVQDAIDKKRDRPLQNRYGLPNITVELRFKLRGCFKTSPGFGRLRSPWICVARRQRYPPFVSPPPRSLTTNFSLGLGPTERF